MFDQTEPNFTSTIPLSRKAIFNESNETQRFYLELLNTKGKKIAEYQLNKELCRIGRTEQCEINLTINHVSRVHAQVSLRNDDYYIEDLKSTNGVYVNGIQISRCLLRDGDIVEIGEARIRYAEEKTRSK